jgi:hypothetical protein
LLDVVNCLVAVSGGSLRQGVSVAGCSLRLAAQLLFGLEA